MSHSMGIFIEKYVLALTQYRPSGTFRLGMPHIIGMAKFLKFLKENFEKFAKKSFVNFLNNM